MRAYIIFCFFPFLGHSQTYLFDVGEKVLRVELRSSQCIESDASFVRAVNAATEAGLLKWEKVQKDTIKSSKIGFYVLVPEPIQNTILINSRTYQPKPGEIALSDSVDTWKASNLDLVKFFQLYFFGLKN